MKKYTSDYREKTRWGYRHSITVPGDIFEPFSYGLFELCDFLKREYNVFKKQLQNRNARDTEYVESFRHIKSPYNYSQYIFTNKDFLSSCATSSFVYCNDAQAADFRKTFNDENTRCWFLSADANKNVDNNFKFRSIIDLIFDEEDANNVINMLNCIVDEIYYSYNYSEKDLQKSIIENLKDFILEIGKDFTFVAKEFRISVGDQDNFIDLLFYNRRYQCLVAFELKVTKFIPEYVSKMNFYLEALDREYKMPNENPSIGIILCSDVNKTIVEYATARTVSPAYIATYSTKLIDEELLKRKLNEYQRIFKK